MSNRTGLAILGAAALLACWPAAARVADNGADKSLAGLDRQIETMRADWRNVGVAVAVVQGDRVTFARGFGVREHGKAAKVDADTLFQVASTSKAFTSAALGMLAAEGKIRWDDPVVDHLPGFQLQDPWLTRHLTIRDALSHRSGIFETWFYLLSTINSDDAIRQLRYITPEAQFRDSYKYSNLLYEAAGKVIQSVSGKSWNEFVKSRLLEPLGMSRTRTSPYEVWDLQYVAPVCFGSPSAAHPGIENARDRNIAMPHSWGESGEVTVLPWQSFDNVAAAGALVSSANDLAKWIVPHLNEGRVAGRQILEKDTVRELHAMQNLGGDDDFPFQEVGEHYALAWVKTNYRGHDYLSHGGGLVGFQSFVAFLPEQKIGVVVLSNTMKIEEGVAFQLNKAITLTVFDRFLGGPATDWNQAFLAKAREIKEKNRAKEEKLRQGRVANTQPTLSLERYAGVYEDSARHSGPVTVKVSNNALQLSFAGEGSFSADLQHWHYDLFRMHSAVGVSDVLGTRPYDFVSFTLDPAGKVSSMSAFGGTFKPVGPASPPAALARDPNPTTTAATPR